MSNNHTIDQLNEYFKKQGGYRTKSEREEFWDEDKLQQNVCDYLRTHHPDLVFHSDLSGAHLNKRQAAMYSRMKSEGFKVPDMHFVGDNYPDLYLELKKLGTTLYTKTGRFVSNDHYKAQAASLLRLRDCGNITDFSVGYVETIHKINRWMSRQSFELTLK